MTGIPAAVTTSARQGAVVSAAGARVTHRNKDVWQTDTHTQRAMQKDEKEEGKSRHQQQQRWESAEQQ